MGTVGGDESETGLVKKKKKTKSTTGIGASLTPDYSCNLVIISDPSKTDTFVVSSNMADLSPTHLPTVWTLIIRMWQRYILLMLNGSHLLVLSRFGFDCKFVGFKKPGAVSCYGTPIST